MWSFQENNNFWWLLGKLVCRIDEYVYRIPNPKHTPKYTKAKVPPFQDKHIQLSSFVELCCHLIKSLATASLPEYVDTYSLPTGHLRPWELDRTLWFAWQGGHHMCSIVFFCFFFLEGGFTASILHSPWSGVMLSHFPQGDIFSRLWIGEPSHPLPLCTASFFRKCHSWWIPCPNLFFHCSP